MGLLDIPGFDPAEFQVSDEERKKLLIGNILLGISAGAFNSNKGNQLGALGSGLLQGAMMGQRALSDAQAAKLDKLKAASGFMDFAEKKRNYMGEQAYNTAMGAFQPSNMPNLPSLAPTPENVAAARPPTEADRVQQRIRYLEENKAKMNIPQKYIDAEYARLEKLAPKYKGMETVMGPDGKPMLVQTYENQAPTPITQYQPKPDITMQDFGGSVGAIDRLRVQNGQMFNKTPTPGELLSNDIAQKNYGISAAHLKLAQDKASQEKGEQFGTPIQITSPDGATQLMIPRKGSNQLVPMVDANGNAVTKSASIPQKYKDTLYSLNNLEGALEDYQSTLKSMKPADFFKASKLTDLEAKFGATQMGLKNLFELGAIAGPDMAILEQNLTNPASMKGASLNAWGGLEAQNKVIKDILARAKKNLAGAYNQRPQDYRPTGDAARMSDDELRKALGF